MSKAALPWRTYLVASAKPLVECSCETFFFLVLVYWIKFERLKREPTNVGSQEILHILTTILLVLVRATLVSSLLFPSLNSSSTSKTKGKRYHHFNHYDSQGVAEDSLGWLRTNID